MPEGTYVSKMKFSYNSDKITAVTASTPENFIFERGLADDSDEVYEVVFAED